MDQKSLWNVNKLSKNDRLRLRESSGVMMSRASPEAVSAYLKARSPGDYSRYRDEIQFACLCMDCQWDMGCSKKSIQELLRDMYRNPETKKRAQEMSEGLLNEKWRRDGYLLSKLNGIVKQIKKQGETKPDFEELTVDLIGWNSEARYVQRKWIRTIYGG